MDVNVYVTNLLRTAVPAGVGVLLTWLAATLHIVVTPHSEAVLVAAFVGGATSAYYALVRWVEMHFPWTGVLLGKPVASMSYTTASTALPDHLVVPSGDDPLNPTLA